MSLRHLLPLTVLATACTTLGPMPATTGVSAIPASRPGVELQAGVMPAFFLSDAAQATDPGSAATPQLAALLDPDRLFGTKGLILGARTWGDDGDRPFEPMIGLRRRLDDTFAIAGIAFGTHARGAESGASYEATRMGAELAIDASLISLASWLAIHGQATASATYLDATGTYCVGGSGQGVDCDATSRHVDGAIEGIYAAATAGISIDLARRPHGMVHGIRVAMMGAIGARPRIRDGVQEPSSDHYKTIGFSLTLGLGDDR
ncbi:MAG: hypothetical protein IPQ07_36450 [Myxococcales bacterium]|nr:hypothetical protein [Myxococcales bacterium]